MKVIRWALVLAAELAVCAALVTIGIRLQTPRLSAAVCSSR